MILIRDLKYAIRLLLKSPGFTILTTLVMATGIGLSVYLFSMFHTMIFKTLPFKDGNSLVQFSSSLNGVKNGGTINLHDYYEIRENLKSVSEFSAFRNISLNVAGRDGARRYSAVAAESNIFQMTRTKPILGREFSVAESQEGAERVVVIGYDVWKNQFGGDREIIDQVLRINGEGHRVIGVMPEGYFFPYAAEMWVPLRENAVQLTRGNAGDVFGLGHLRDGVAMDEVNRAIAVIMQRLEQRYPKTNTGIGAYVSTLPMVIVGDGVAIVNSLQVVAILILLLASVNVGNLLLSRAIERRKETAIRVALGAPRSRLISQMLWESIIICTIGGIIGLVVLGWGLKLTEGITASFSAETPFWWKFGIDAYTLEIALTFILVTILATGLVPAWKNSGGDFNAALRDGTRGALGKKAGSFNRMLVITEIFVALTVLIAAGVMTVINYKAVRADYGVENPSNLLTAQVLLTETEYADEVQKGQFFKTLQSRLENNVGISDVVITSELPSQKAEARGVAMEGREYSEDKGYPRTNYIVLSPGSLDKLGIQIKEGRYFNNGDDGLGKTTVVVTDSFSERHFPNTSPIGKRIRIVESDDSKTDWLTIVGVVEHTIHGASFEEAGQRPSVFRPYSQAPRNLMTVAMRIESDQQEKVKAIRKTLASIDSDLPVFRISPYTEVVGRQTKPLLFITTIFLLFGIAAAILAGSGIYGVISNTINQRTQEIGIKRALGALDGGITKEFLKRGLNQLLWGGIPGLIAGGLMGFGMAQAFPGVTDGSDVLMVIFMLVGLIGGVVMVASYLPTKRVLEMEPIQALRYE